MLLNTQLALKFTSSKNDILEKNFGQICPKTILVAICLLFPIKKFVKFLARGAFIRTNIIFIFKFIYLSEQEFLRLMAPGLSLSRHPAKTFIPIVSSFLTRA